MRVQLQEYFPDIKNTLDEADNNYLKQYKTGIATFLRNNNLNEFSDEFLLLALLYRTSLEENMYFKEVNGITIESHWHEYNKQVESLRKLISDLNIVAEPHEAEEAFFIDSIVIKCTKKGDSKTLTIKNYSLCYDIAMTLAKLMEIPMYYEKETRQKNTSQITSPQKKPSSYIKSFISDTYPLFLFLKNECLPNKTSTECYRIISEFLDVLKFDWGTTKQLREDYIKNCFRNERS